MLNIEIENVENTEERVITLKFIGNMSFKIDENGVLVDGEKTFTFRELYDSLKPEELEYQAEEEIAVDGQFQ
mgnify:CR=1 FL=1